MSIKEAADGTIVALIYYDPNRNDHCRLCTAYEQKAFLDGLRFGAELVMTLTEK